MSRQIKNLHMHFDLEKKNKNKKKKKKKKKNQHRYLFHVFSEFNLLYYFSKKIISMLMWGFAIFTLLTVLLIEDERSESVLYLKLLQLHLFHFDLILNFQSR